MSQPRPDFRSLSVAERIHLAEDTWDSIAAENPDSVVLSPEQPQEIRARSLAHDQDPSTALPSPQVKSAFSRAIMQSVPNQSRRSFIISIAGVATVVIAAGTSGCQGGSNNRQLKFTSLAAAEEELARLVQAEDLVSSTTWNWAQTLMHCAQSIEYSMTGYPQTNSKLFQRTVGSAAFEAFSWRGRMAHDLAEPIPGAPVLEANVDPARALERLRGAVLGFRQWSGLLKPHFAYGALSKKEYELAHAMHLANHLSAFHAEGLLRATHLRMGRKPKTL